MLCLKQTIPLKILWNLSSTIFTWSIIEYFLPFDHWVSFYKQFILNDTTRVEMTQTLIFIFFKGSKARKKISTLTLAWTLVNWGLNNYVPNFQRNGHVFLLLPPLGTLINFLHKRERLNPNLFHTVLSCGKT